MGLHNFLPPAAPRQTMRPAVYEPQKDLKMALFSYFHSYTAIPIRPLGHCGWADQHENAARLHPSARGLRIPQ
jgi:hypothetical protein